MRSFVGFGFGPIQNALVLYEAYKSGNFGAFTVAEVDPAMVAAVRANGGRYTINIAHPDRIEAAVVEGVELLNPLVPAERAQLVERIARADEMATALPSVDFFDKPGPGSVAQLLAEGLARRAPGHRSVLYACENHNHAGAILTERIGRYAPASLAGFQALETVIGKMSGVIADAATIARLKLVTMTPTTARAVLVEPFNRILVSRVALPVFTRGIAVFAEKPDLMPFEEAKLYGHNAVHALIGYLGRRRGLSSMAEAAAHPDLMATARTAFSDECGAALCVRHRGVDALFTADGWRAYVDDLLVRMVNPNLDDLVERITRDPRRKLGWDDRLFGTMRVALAQQVVPKAMAAGAAAAAGMFADEQKKPLATRADLAALVRPLWPADADAAVVERLLDLAWEARGRLAAAAR